MGTAEAKAAIIANKTALGIEFGSTRIKAVLVDDKNQPIASGAHEWENRYENGVWTYSLDDIWTGIQDCYQDMAKDVKAKYDIELESVGAFGVSAMMHGYMPFNKEGELLVPFRTWRNNITGEASEKLMELFNYNIPQRWSIAHLYQAILNGEEHVKDIDYITTLEAYVHWKLTGKRVLGIGDAAGMFPIDTTKADYNQEMVDKHSFSRSGRSHSQSLAGGQHIDQTRFSYIRTTDESIFGKSACRTFLHVCVANHKFCACYFHFLVICFFDINISPAKVSVPFNISNS